MTSQTSGMGGIGRRAARLAALVLFVCAQPQLVCVLHCLRSGHVPVAVAPLSSVALMGPMGHDGAAADCHHQEAGSVRPHAPPPVVMGPPPTRTAVSTSFRPTHAPPPTTAMASSSLFPRVESPPPRA